MVGAAYGEGLHDIAIYHTQGPILQNFFARNLRNFVIS